MNNTGGPVTDVDGEPHTVTGPLGGMGEVTMACTGTAARMSEFEYVAGLGARAIAACYGPLVTLVFTDDAAGLLEDAIGHRDVVAFLWRSYLPDHDPTGDRVAFGVCAGHWFDLCAHINLRGQIGGNEMALTVSRALLSDVCQHAGWDRKEMSNYFGWRRVPLT